MGKRMELAVHGQEDHAAIFPFRGDSISEVVGEAPGEGPDRRMARDVVGLEAEAALADETVALAFDEHRFRDTVQLRVLVLPSEVPALDEGVPDDRPRRQRREQREGLLQFPPLVAGLRDDEFSIDLLVRRRHRHVQLRREATLPVHPTEGRRRRAVRDEEGGHVASLEFVDHLPEATVQGRLPREADRDVRWMPSLEEPFPRDIRIALEPAEELPLRPNGIFNNETGIVRQEERIGSPLLGAPTELAGQVARIDGRSHLEAAVALDAVERLLVTSDALREACLGPVTQLDAAVLADDPIPLPLQDFLLLRIHPARHAGPGLKDFLDHRLRDSRPSLYVGLTARRSRPRRRPAIAPPPVHGPGGQRPERPFPEGASRRGSSRLRPGGWLPRAHRGPGSPSGA